ncbi:TIGR00730 family Rossman fold protein [Candidatus Parcubacteria bacterium]|nr:TIGR00730 family Rossman fold protein [Candidatus Parcubacteria bacterium]
MADEIIPPKIIPAATDEAARHRHMGTRLLRAVEEGKESVPAMPDPLVCKPRELEPWRVFKIMSEVVEGFELIQKYTLAATIFGSTRATLEHDLYQQAADLAGKLAKRGFAIITGGSAGIMEAANKGAFEAGGASVGLNIRLEERQPMNRYVTEQIFFDHFFVRKVMLTFASHVYVYFPGGFGTLDEFYEILTLVQTKKIQRIPIVLYGREYWAPILRHFEETLLQHYHSVDEEDLKLYHVVDTVDEAYDYIVKNTKC